MIGEFKKITNYEDKREINDDFMNYPLKAVLADIIIKKRFRKIRRFKYLKLNSKILAIILFFVAYLLYFLSLEKCLLGLADCPLKVSWMKRKIKELLISCVILFILIELMIYNKIARLNIIHMIITFSIFYIFSHGLDFEDHGFFNFIGYFSFLSIMILFFTSFSMLICILHSKSKLFKILYIIILSTSIISIGYIYQININDCDDWPKGLNNSFIDNNSSKYGCQIELPKKCPYKFFSSIQDYTKLTGKKCKIHKLSGSKEKLISNSKSPFLKEKTNRIGYPLTNKDTSCFLDFINEHNLVEEYFFNNLVDMDNATILENNFKDKIPEVEVDFTNNTQGEMIINLHFNKTLSEERKLLESGNKPYSNNVLILYIDSVSRANSIRKLKKTTKFFEQFMSFEGSFNEKYPTEIFHSFQFFKYHSFQYYTGYNFPILFFGQQRLSKKVLITKYFKKNGYITGYTGDYCYKDNLRVLHNSTLDEVYDHQFLICDPNDDHYNTNTLKCLYGKPTTQHLYEYGLQFWNKYNNNRKFLAIISNDGHEGTLEALKYIDNIIYKFLIELFNNNLLKESSIFLLSDHGVGMPSFYYGYKFYSIEENLPMLYILVNDRKNLSYEHQFKYIYENQQTFITGFDIYNTFGNIIFGDEYALIKNKSLDHDTCKSEFGTSLFDKINQKMRSPENYQFSSGINKQYCK